MPMTMLTFKCRNFFCAGEVAMLKGPFVWFYCRITLEENKHLYGRTSISIKMLAKRLIVIFKKIATFTSKLLANFFETEGNFAKLTSRAEYERRVV